MKLWEVPAIYTHIINVHYNTSRHSDTNMLSQVASFRGLPGVILFVGFYPLLVLYANQRTKYTYQIIT